MNVKERVEAGAAFLDEQRPGWRNEINVEILRLSDNDLCVLGQLCGDYEYGKARYDLGEREAEQLGFNTETDDDPYDHTKHDREYQQLDEAWREVISR